MKRICVAVILSAATGLAQGAVSYSTIHGVEYDDLNNLIAVRDLISYSEGNELPGDLGWHPANTDSNNQLPIFTDDVGGFGFAGLLNENSPGVPVKRVHYDSQFSAYHRVYSIYADISEIRILSGSPDKNGRVFSTTVVSVSTDNGASYSQLGYFQSDPSGTSNSGQWGSTLVSIFDDANPGVAPLATGVTDIIFEFYSVDNTAGQMRDPFDGVNPFTSTDDGLTAAFVSPPIWEIDVIGTAYFPPFPQPPPSHLLAYWDFRDASGSVAVDRVSGHIARLEGGAAFGSSGGYATPGSVDFGRTSDGQTLHVPDASFLNTGADTVTYSFWQALDQDFHLAAPNSSSFWAVSPSSSDRMRGAQAHVPWDADAEDSGTIYFDTAGCCDTDTQRIYGEVSDHNYTGWRHYAFVKDGNLKQVYVNGRLAFEGENSDPLPTDFTELFIGSGINGDESIAGRINDFAIYDIALNGSHIAWIANESPLIYSADHDVDGDVDGNDFLLWQRDPSIGSLGNWHYYFDILSRVRSPTSVAVPEPTSLALVSLAAAAYLSRCRKLF